MLSFFFKEHFCHSFLQLGEAIQIFAYVFVDVFLDE